MTRQSLLFSIGALVGCGGAPTDPAPASVAVLVEPSCPDGHVFEGGVCTLEACERDGYTRDAATLACVRVTEETCTGGPCALLATTGPDTVASMPSIPGDASRNNDRLLLDERALRGKPRSRSLVITELASLERLYAATPVGDVDRPRLLARIAEQYSELAAASAIDAVEAPLPKARLEASKIEALAHTKALEAYQKILTDHPQFCRSTNRGCDDATLYHLSIEQLLARDPVSAKKTWLELVTKWPQSAYRPAAFVGFAEIFAGEAKNDPSKWEVSRRFYEKALTFPSHRLTGFALFGLARAYAADGDSTSGQRYYRRVLEHLAQNPNAAGAAALEREAQSAIQP